MFVTDTRYTAGEWLQQLPLKSGMTVDFFTMKVHLPHFDRPPFPLRFVPYVLEPRDDGGQFWKEMYAYLVDPANGVIVDAESSTLDT